MKVRMTETRRASDDGFTVKRFHAGEEYNVSHSLYIVFLNNAWAVSLEPETTPEEQTQALLQHLASLRVKERIITNPSTLISKGVLS
jgi:hypothetical protein